MGIADDLDTGRVRDVGAVGSSPEAPIVDGDRVWIHNTLDETVSVVDIRSLEISEPLPIPDIDSPLFALEFESLWMPDFTTNFVYRLEP